MHLESEELEEKRVLYQQHYEEFLANHQVQKIQLYQANFEAQMENYRNRVIDSSLFNAHPIQSITYQSDDDVIAKLDQVVLETADDRNALEDFLIITGLIYRDNVLSKERKKFVEQKVAHIALEPMSVDELPRKVKVYLAPPLGDGIYKTRIHFREYVKPVLVAAAMEYELVEGTQPGQLRSKVRDEIIEKRKAAKASTNIESNNTRQEPNLLNKTVGDGAIVIGRVSFVEYLQGLNEGCASSLTESQEIPNEKDMKTNDNNNDSMSLAENIMSDSLRNSQVVKQDEFSVPELEPIGYIRFYNRIGWRYLPLRMYHALNSFLNFDTVGEDAVKVVFKNTREFTDDDLNLGIDEKKFLKGTLENPELDHRILSKLRIYI
ncbi:14867_t:CDS:2 [Dentiscutata erythropus]|uniref:Mitochondrial import inner membrane translocase subunit TIM54 n=1 Tax=Dentiscutata erythropus TaxID=1348616 RepID=A0A9N8WC56_9GLOM|nr:14867_t:CDS:2 [Dentiscutata erythropus]